MRKYLLIIPMLCLCASSFAYTKTGTETGYLGKNQWVVQKDGDILPTTDSSYDIGESGAEVANLYVDAITTSGNLTATGDIIGDGTGEISGMLTDNEIATTDTLVVADSGRVSIVTTSSTKTLPAYTEGWSQIFLDGGGVTMTIDTASTADTIKYLTLDAGDTLDSAGATGDTIYIVGGSTANTWYASCYPTACTDGGQT